MEMHGVALSGRRVLAYHDANGPKMRPRLLAALAEGRSVAYASEAGTPLVADPGFALVRDAIGEGRAVHAAPGPVAAIMALTLSGLPSDIFTFTGFLPQAASARRRALSRLKDAPGTLILYESPKRVEKTLGDVLEVMGDREVALCRELTKKFEEVRRGRVSDILRDLGEVRGECVLCLGAAEPEAPEEGELIEELKRLLESEKLKAASRMLAERHGLSQREVYQLGLSLKGD